MFLHYTTIISFYLSSLQLQLKGNQNRATEEAAQQCCTATQSTRNLKF